MQTLARRLGTLLFFLAIANFACFLVVSVFLGGDALQGKIENGRYYLLKLNHRETMYVETGPSLWWFSRIHGISVLVTHALGLIGGGGLLTYAGRQRKKSAMNAG